MTKKTKCLKPRSFLLQESEAKADAEAVGSALRDVIKFAEENVPKNLEAELVKKIEFVQNSIAKTNYNIVKLQDIYHDTELRHLFVKHRLDRLTHKVEASKRKLKKCSFFQNSPKKYPFSNKSCSINTSAFSSFQKSLKTKRNLHLLIVH
jgi:hypothetical protein